MMNCMGNYLVIHIKLKSVLWLYSKKVCLGQGNGLVQQATIHCLYQWRGIGTLCMYWVGVNKVIFENKIVSGYFSSSLSGVESFPVLMSVLGNHHFIYFYKVYSLCQFFHCLTKLVFLFHKHVSSEMDPWNSRPSSRWLRWISKLHQDGCAWLEPLD